MKIQQQMRLLTKCSHLYVFFYFTPSKISFTLPSGCQPLQRSDDQKRQTEGGAEQSLSRAGPFPETAQKTNQC